MISHKSCVSSSVGIGRDAENGSSLHQSNLLRRSLHPILEKLGIEKHGFLCFRRLRITHLRKQSVSASANGLRGGMAP